jgi:predicted Zn-dependent protease
MPAQPAWPAIPEPKEALPTRPESPVYPGPPAAPMDPKAAGAQWIEFGNGAFKAHQYSRAERSFRRATEELPGDPPAYFLLAQARFALGKYVEAVAAIHAGMRLQPDWPTAHFRPRDFYGANPYAFYEQLQRLANALAKYPHDPVLAFLYAYELWFDNRKDEARMIFQRAKMLAPDPSFSERFLQTKADTAVSDVVIELFPPGPRF